MAIDTPAKRSSALDHEEVWAWGTPLPDGTVGAGDRAHLLWSYGGLFGVVVQLIPYRWAALDAHDPGLVAASLFDPGPIAMYCHDPGALASFVHDVGAAATDNHAPGAAVTATI